MTTYQSTIGEITPNQIGEQEYDTRPSAPEQEEVEYLPEWQDSFQIPDIKWVPTYIVSKDGDIPSLPDGDWKCINPVNNHVFALIQSRCGKFNGMVVKYTKKKTIKTIGNFVNGIGCVMSFVNGKLFYHGYTKNRSAYNYGIVTMTSFTYKGNFVDGKRHGHGTMYYKTGDKYVGDFANNKRHGNGKIERKNGDTYTGQFQDDKIHGYGKTCYKNGNVYEGEYKDGKRNGIGKVTLFSGDVYVGEFVDNKANGTGLLTYANGNIYQGQFKDNKAHGKGTITLADGRQLEREFRNGNLVKMISIFVRICSLGVL